MKPLPLALAVAALAVAPSAAHAGTASLEPNAATGGKRVLYQASAGERNYVSATLQGSQYVLQESGSGAVQPETPCTQWEDPNHEIWGTAAFCPAGGVDALEIRLGADNDYASLGGMGSIPVPALEVMGPGNDSLFGSDHTDTVFGEGGDDTINPYKGRDRVIGGAGDDTIEAQDGDTDQIWCGDGNDAVKADPNDVMAADCEEVNGEQRATGPVTDTPEVPPAEQETVTPTIMQEIDLTSLDDALADGLTFKAGCSQTCTITSELRVSEKLKRRLGLRSAVVGRSGSAQASRPHRFRVRFAKRARRALRGKASLLVTLRIDAVDSDGNPFAAETKLRLRRSKGD